MRGSDDADPGHWIFLAACIVIALIVIGSAALSLLQLI